MADIGWARPALKDIRTRLTGALSGLRRQDRTVEATAVAGAVHLLHGHQEAIARQIIPDTASGAYLAMHSRRYGIVPKSAAAAVGSVTVTGSGLLPSGVLLQRSDGLLYRVTADVVVSASASASIAAVEGGAAGNAEAGTSLTLVSPVAGLSSSMIAVEIGGGTDAETDESLLSRLLARIQEPPHGGAAHDYTAWALAVDGVTRCWVLPKHLGPGTVGVAIACDGQADPYAITAETIAAVAAAISDARPVTADVTVFGPETVAVNVSLQVTPDTAAVRTAVEAALADMIALTAAPGVTILRSHITEAISLAAGETDHVLISPAANVTVAAGQIAVLGAVTFSAG